MGKLIYGMNVSLDGFIETPDQRLDWTIVDAEIHTFWERQEGAADASLYGRRLYEVMGAYWPTAADDPDATDFVRSYAAVWNARPHLVFSRTLREVRPPFELAPLGDDGDVAAALDRIRERFSGDLNVCGPTLASAFIERGLVDEYRMVIHPVVLGAGTPYFPRLERPIGLRLADQRTFGSGVTYLRYQAR